MNDESRTAERGRNAPAVGNKSNSRYYPAFDVWIQDKCRTHIKTVLSSYSQPRTLKSCVKSRIVTWALDKSISYERAESVIHAGGLTHA